MAGERVGESKQLGEAAMEVPQVDVLVVAHNLSAQQEGTR